jgi:hypothetical protein
MLSLNLGRDAEYTDRIDRFLYSDPYTDLRTSKNPSLLVLGILQQKWG